MSSMNVSVIIVASTALILSKITFLLNSYLLLARFWFKTIQSKTDMSLIYSRFAVDMCYAFANTISLAYFLIRGFFPSFTVKNLSFFLAWPTLNLGTIRLFLVLFITLDRLFASCAPILYMRHRSRFPNLVLLSFIFSYTGFEHFILFKICDFQLDSPAAQTTGQVGVCYRNYWLYFEQTGYSIIGVLSLLLCFRLFIWNYFTKTQQRKKISRTTRISLLDSVIIFSFDVLPSFLFVNFPQINFSNVGPLSAFCKNFGFVIESVIICRVLLEKKIRITISGNRISHHTT